MNLPDKFTVTVPSYPEVKSITLQRLYGQFFSVKADVPEGYFEARCSTPYTSIEASEVQAFIQSGDWIIKPELPDEFTIKSRSQRVYKITRRGDGDFDMTASNGYLYGPRTKQHVEQFLEEGAWVMYDEKAEASKAAKVAMKAAMESAYENMLVAISAYGLAVKNLERSNHA